MENKPSVSVIVPVFNESENLQQLYNDLIVSLLELERDFEIVFVNDGSKDATSSVLEKIAGQDKRVKIVELTRNFGQTAAMAAGFQVARGEILVAIDADNQNDPADIAHLIKKLDEGYDVVSGWRKNRKDKFFSRVLPSKAANWIISRVTGVKLKDYGCSLKVYRASAIASINLYGEMHRFIPALAAMGGAKVAEVEVNHRPRLHGKSKYGLIRIFKVLIDLVTVKFLSSWATKPSYLFGGIGSILCIAAFLSGVEVLIEKFWKGTFAHKNPMLLLAVFLFTVGIQFIFMGLIAELLVRTYHESQGKPIYFVKRTLNIV